MPIVSRPLFKSNIVKNPPDLPVPIKLGSLTVTKSFQDHPSASITYEGITEEDISSYEQVYDPSRNTRITIDGIPFRVAPDGGYGYERTGYLYKGTQKINVYTVSINLEGWWKVYCSRSVKIKPLVNIATGTLSASRLASKAGVNLSGGFNIFIDEVGEDSMISLDDVLGEYALVQGCYVHYGQFVGLKNINSGSSYSFSWGEQIADGSNQLGVAPYYNGAALTWTPRESNKEQVDPNSPPEFEEKEPELKTEYEYDQDVTNPPKGTTILRSLDSNLDQSGPKKVRRTTYTIDGQTDREVIETWGFAYYLKDFIETPDGLMITNPGNYWKLIEFQETRYYYQAVEPPTYTLTTPKNTKEIEYQLTVHPDYEEYLGRGDSLKGLQSKVSNAKYLTSIVTSGWKLSRFQQEEPGGDTDTREMTFVNGEGMIDEMEWGWGYVGPPGQERMQWILKKTGRLILAPWWKVVKFQKINRQDVTSFYIKSMRADYEQDTVPYSIEWVFWDEMDEQMQRKMFSKVTPPEEGSNRKLKVGLITADMDFVEPMLVWTESRQASSIAVMAHPDSTSEDPLPALVTGEESYYQSIWTKKNDEYSTEKIVELTASGAGFVDGVENVRYREIQGRPPEAQYRKTTWEQQQPKKTYTKSVVTTKEGVGKRYFVYSDSIPEWASEGGESLSFGAASTLEQAKEAAKTQLTINTLQSTQETRTVSWHFPNIEGGDFCTFSGDRFRGRFRVLSASYTLEYDGSQNAYGLDPICKTDGTKLTLGLSDSRSIRIETIEDTVPSNEGSDNNQGEDPKVDNNATIITLGGVLPSTVPGRRN
jgi:hypothetical protein